MGLVISALTEINADLKRSCWLYLLDYGLKSEVSEALRKNFFHYAERSSEAGSVFIMGSSHHVQSDILSWHSVFGLPGERHLPALLVCTINPRLIMDESVRREDLSGQGHKAILIPLTGSNITVEEALIRVDQVFDQIVKNDLDSIFEEQSTNPTDNPVPVIMLQPNISGVGINFNELYRRFRDR
jgi:hypothetical protein